MTAAHRLRASIRDTAIAFLDNVTSTSRASPPTAAEITFLQETVASSNYTLYRGLTISLSDLTKLQRLELRRLSEGAPVPEQFLKPPAVSAVLHFSKSKGVASSYASGRPSLLMEVVIQPKHIICDTTSLSKLLKPSELDADTWAYLKKEREVFVHPDAKFVSATVLRVRL